MGWCQSNYRSNGSFFLDTVAGEFGGWPASPPRRMALERPFWKGKYERVCGFSGGGPGHIERVGDGLPDGDRFSLEEIHRFPNAGERFDTRLRCDVLRIWSEIHADLKKFRISWSEAPAGIGINAWDVYWTSVTDCPGILITTGLCNLSRIRLPMAVLGGKRLSVIDLSLVNAPTRSMKPAVYEVGDKK